MHARMQSIPVARSVDHPILIRNVEEQYRNASLRPPRQPESRDSSPPRMRARSGAPSPPDRSRASTHVGQSSSTPRRPITAEADTCPVCHLELPRAVATSNPATNFREIHIRNCVESRFSAQPAQPPRATIVSNPPAAYVANRVCIPKYLG